MNMVNYTNINTFKYYYYLKKQVTQLTNNSLKGFFHIIYKLQIEVE